MRAVCRLVVVAAVSGTAVLGMASARAEVTAEQVLAAIRDGKEFLVRQQNGDGSWGGADARTGCTSLAVMALLQSGMTLDDKQVRDGLAFLRRVRDDDLAGRHETYETSLLAMALAAAKDGRRDQPRLLALAARIENGQVVRGVNAGSWTYTLRGENILFNLGGDRSNGQYAVLGLREAAYAGVPIAPATWLRIRQHWLASQNPDGGWHYSGGPGGGSYGSMTVAGIATLSIVKTMLRDDKVRRDGTPDCCADHEDPEIDAALDRAIRWMEGHFAVTNNPNNQGFLLYYLYGLERAGRLSGRRFFGEHDWYREGADFLVRNQTPRDGGWRGVGQYESDPLFGTSFALLFLSKGLAPVLMNKLKYGPINRVGADVVGDAWKQHPEDARNLTEHISGLPKWPKLVTWQVLDLPKAMRAPGVGDFLQAPVLYVTGRQAPTFSDAEAARFREYVDQGGFVFAVAGCDRAGFDAAIRELVARMYPNGEGELKRLGPDHPIFRSEHALDPDAVELWGVEVGCRTAVVYSPDDLGCYWERWLPYDPPGRNPKLTAMVTQKLRVGVNVVAYATGREPPTKLDVHTDAEGDGETDAVERGLLQLAKLRHGGSWDAAPRALHNLLVALNKEQPGDPVASTKPGSLVASDPDLYKYPVVTMHGRTNFSLGPNEIAKLREHLNRGGVLFADACCGAPAFDASFRGLVKSLYPEHEMKRIPPDHELFTTAVGADLSKVRRRVPGGGGDVLDSNVVVGEPYLEGVEIDGRYPIIYSKYDISCALEKQSSAACAGYLPEDAVRIAVNVIRYAMLQDIVHEAAPGIGDVR